jgi:hypothetical protein
MSAIALLIEQGKLVGFLLLANPAALATVPSNSDCLLSGVPSATSLHPLGAFVQSHKHNEFQCHIERQGELLVLVANPSSGSELRIELTATGTGRWKVTTDGQLNEGLCELAGK